MEQTDCNHSVPGALLPADRPPTLDIQQPEPELQHRLEAAESPQASTSPSKALPASDPKSLAARPTSSPVPHLAWLLSLPSPASPAPAATMATSATPPQQPEPTNMSPDSGPLLPQVPADAPYWLSCLQHERAVAHAAANNHPTTSLLLNPVAAVTTILIKRKTPSSQVSWTPSECTYGPSVGTRFGCTVRLLGKAYTVKALYQSKDRAKRDAAWLVLMGLWCSSVEQWHQATAWVTSMDLHRAVASGAMLSLIDYYQAILKDFPQTLLPGRPGVPLVGNELDSLSQQPQPSGGGSSDPSIGVSANLTPLALAAVSRKTPKMRVVELGTHIPALVPVWGTWFRVAADTKWQVELRLGQSDVCAIGSGAKRKEAEDVAALTCLRTILDDPIWGPKIMADDKLMHKCFLGLEAFGTIQNQAGGEQKKPAPTLDSMQLDTRATSPSNSTTAARNLGGQVDRLSDGMASNDRSLGTHPLLGVRPPVPQATSLGGQPASGQPSSLPAWLPSTLPFAPLTPGQEPTFSSASPATPVPPTVSAQARAPNTAAQPTKVLNSATVWDAWARLEEECAQLSVPVSLSIVSSNALPTFQAPTPALGTRGQWIVRVHLALPHGVPLDVTQVGEDRMAVLRAVVQEAWDRLHVWYGAMQITLAP